MTVSKKMLAIVRDMVSKYPKGPEGKLKKEDYVVLSLWSEPHGKYRETAVLRNYSEGEVRQLCGYSPETIYSLFQNSHSPRDLVCDAFPVGLSRAKVTRRTNILKQRLEECKSYVRLHGIPGVYTARWGYQTSNRAYIYGKDIKDVQATASILGSAYGFDITEEAHITFHEQAPPERALQLNNDTIESDIRYSEANLKRAEERYNSAREDLDHLRNRSAILESLFQMQNESQDV